MGAGAGGVVVAIVFVGCRQQQRGRYLPLQLSAHKPFFFGFFASVPTSLSTASFDGDRFGQRTQYSYADYY